MALARTNRGTATLSSGSYTNPSIATSSFSPAAGSLLVAIVDNVAFNASSSISMSTTLSGHGSWTKRVQSTLTNDGFGNYFSSYVFTSVCGSSPGSGTVTASDVAGTYIDGIFLEVIEVSGFDPTTPVRQTVSNTGTGGSIATNFGSAPLATSMVFGSGFNGGATAPTVPTGFTGIGAGSPSAGNWEAQHGEDLASAAQNNTWGGFGFFWGAAVLVEIAAATFNPIFLPARTIYRGR